MNSLFESFGITKLERKNPIFAVYDTETTGLTIHPKGEVEKQPRIIEFAGILTDGVNILKTVEFICNPGIAIEDVITKITGLTNADLDGEPPFSHFLPVLKNYFGAANIAVAHNLAFDRDLLTYDLRRIDKEISDIDFPEIMCCTVEQTLPLFGRRMRLETLYNLEIGDYEQKHRALDDILLLHKLCKQTGVYASYMGGEK